MRILHLIDKLEIGGAQQVLNTILTDNPDHHAYVLRDCAHPLPIASNHLHHNPHPWLPFPLPHLSTFITDHSPHTLHCHLANSYLNGWLLKRFFFPNLNLVFHLHAHPQESPFLPNLLGLTKGQVDLFIAVSESVKQSLVNLGLNSSTITVLENPLNAIYFTKPKRSHLSKLRKSLHLKPTDFVIGYVGRLQPVKGPDLLLHSLPRLTFPFKAVFVGAGPLDTKLHHTASRLGLIGQVTFTGAVPDSSPYYPLFDLLVVPSLSEGFCLTGLEAFASKTPLLASTHINRPELFTDMSTSLLTDPKSAPGLASAISLLYHNQSLRRRLITTAYPLARRYHPARYLKQLNHLYTTHDLL